METACPVSVLSSFPKAAPSFKFTLAAADSSLSAKDEGKVLIHCMVGRSRSITIFLAFLINILCGNFNQKCVKTTIVIQMTGN